jgi:hypothetical protein
MKKPNLILGTILFVLGLLGILSTLTMALPVSKETMEALKDLTPLQIKIVLVIQPSILLMIAVVIGVLLHKKVDLQVPIIEGIGKTEKQWSLLEISKYGILGGIITGILSTIIGFVYYPYLPNELRELGENFRPNLAVRFLYGGFTEEIIFRFGFMTLVVWLTSKIPKRGAVNIYWVGILVTATIFAMGHLPVLFQSVENPSMALITYLLIATSFGGIVFGWLYWKKGLESAFIAHICSHVVVVIGEPLIG